ncbi:MAG TPA: UbiA family prenyltransferase, partial [Candidatus Sulfotelmatobacter sp.]|nr:UbiA family prenyltransferase [Candidatus Sulfotelmatobacter sp.]
EHPSHAPPRSATPPSHPPRWWVYQRERFPLFAHGPLVLAFSSSAVCFSRLLRGQLAWPAWSGWAVAFVTCLLFFLGLRIADEFKDVEEDARFRPYRPVPRGLVSLGELGRAGAGAAAIQLVLALWLAPLLVLVLLLGWLYLALMSKEFFVREWLKARPITYLWTHMFIMPIVDLYATACDWVPAGLKLPPPGLSWFLAASFFNGIVIEFGRKIRAPANEEIGVQTYSVLWGRQTAVLAWLGVMTVTAICAICAARRIDFAWPVGMATSLVLGLAIVAGFGFLRAPKPGSGKRFELIAGVWTLVLYLSLGLVPLAWRLLKG